LSKIGDNASNVDKPLVDSFGRVAHKLRLSVTDRCNMQCVYCMPKDTDKDDESRNVDNSLSGRWFPKNELLSYEEL